MFDVIGSSKGTSLGITLERWGSLSTDALKPRQATEDVASPRELTVGERVKEQVVHEEVVTMMAKRKQELSQILEDVTVVLPTLDEQEGIASVIDNVRRAGFSRILVVDGGSVDRTVQIAEEKGIVVLFQHGHGKTDAVDTAVAFVKTRYLALMDADDTYDPLDILAMLEQIQHSDQVIGSRMLGEKNGRNGQTDHLATGHGFGNRVLNRVFNTFFGIHLTDVLSGIRLMRTSVLKDVQFRSTGFGAEAELTAQFLMEGRKVVETPASFRRRLGNAKLGYLDGFRILGTTLRLAYEYNPLVFFMPVGMALMVPAIGFLADVLYLAEFAPTRTFYTSGALAGMGLFLTGMLFAGFAAMSFLMKRIELRQLRVIRALAQET